jgi:hypothetical protein
MDLQKIIEILYHFGEPFILSLACLSFIGIIPTIKRLLIFSLFFGCFVITLRMQLLPAMNIPNGFHVIIFFIFNIIFLILVFKLTFMGAVICDLLYFMTIMIFENLTLIIFKIMGFSPAFVVSSPVYFNIFRWLNFLFISLLVYAFLKNKFILIPIKKVFKMERNGNTKNTSSRISNI